MRGLLAAGPFRWMWAGETVSMLGDGVHTIALAWLTLVLTGSPLALGSVLLAGAAPRAALVLVGGAVTDRLSPRTLLLASNGARAAIAAVLAGLIVSGTVQLWGLYATSFAFGLSDAFFRPAVGAIVPGLVADGRHLSAANALLGAGEQATMLVGPAVGGLLVAAIGPGGAFAVNGASFLLAAAGVLPAAVTKAPPGPRATVLADVREGLTYAWTRVDLRVVLLVGSVEALTYNGVFSVGLPALARSLVQGPVALGLLYSSWGCGQLTGALSAARTGLPRRWGHLMIGTAAWAGTAFVALGLVRSLGRDMAILATLGFGVAYASDVALPTWIQRSTSTALLGRVNSLIELPRASLAPASLLAFGVLARLDLAAAFAACGAAMLITAVAAAGSRSARQLVIP